MVIQWHLLYILYFYAHIVMLLCHWKLFTIFPHYTFLHFILPHYSRLRNICNIAVSFPPISVSNISTKLYKFESRFPNIAHTYGVVNTHSRVNFSRSLASVVDNPNLPIMLTKLFPSPLSRGRQIDIPAATRPPRPVNEE